MMETIKGIARRTTQSLRERVSGSESSPPDPQVVEVSRKVRTMEAKSVSICEKIIRAARLMEDLGNTLKEIGEEYQLVPDLAMESRQLAEDVRDVGTKLVETSQEHQKGLKDNGFDLLQHFARDCGKLKEMEEAERHHQLEYDFFKAKVIQLRQTPQKDFTRIPRNEQILENWRVELWRVSEAQRALLSRLYLDGRRAIDCGVLTTVQVLNSFVDIASTGFKQTFYNARLPEYPQDPVLPPTPLPPNPLPPQNQRAIANGPFAQTPSAASGNYEVSGGNSPYHPPPQLTLGVDPSTRSWSQPSGQPSPIQPPQAPQPWGPTAAAPTMAIQASASVSSGPGGYNGSSSGYAPSTYQPPPVGASSQSAAPPSSTGAYQPPWV